MAIPPPETFMLPVLNQFGAQRIMTSEQMHGPIAMLFNLTDADLALMQDSGSPVFVNYVAWAIKRLLEIKAIRGLGREKGKINRLSTGIYMITPYGKELIKDVASGKVDLNELIEGH